MKKIIAVFLLLSFAFLSFPVRAEMLVNTFETFSAEDYMIEPDRSEEVAKIEENALSAILIDSGSGEVLYESNPDEKLPIASVTKVMTLLLIVEAIDEGVIKLDDVVTVSENAASMGGSQAFMETGEKMSVHEMLKAITVSSCNDAAVAMAEHLAGSESAFVERMNKRAEELGMTNTEFLNCTGLDDREIHYSTARDVARMSRELISHPLIFDYTTIWMDTIRNGEFGLSNTNKLIRFYNGANGLKTGSTSKAKYCLSATAQRDGLGLVAVVLGADSSAHRFSSAKGLLDYGFANFAVYTPKSTIPESVRVWGGKEKSVKTTFSTLPFVINKADASKVEEEVVLSKEQNAPLKKGDVLGKIIYKIGDKIILETPILTENEVKSANFFDRFSDILKSAFSHNR